MDWRQTVRHRQALRRREFFLSLVVMYALWFGLFGVGWFAWAKMFGAAPGPNLALTTFLALGGSLVSAFVRYGPALPFKGKAPEEVAAETFLAGNDVRYDDDNYEPDLKS